MNHRFTQSILMSMGLFLISGCSSSLSQAYFRNQNIFIGQSNDSIEKTLGAPDNVTSARGFGKPFTFGILYARRIDPWVSQGELTIEWIYFDQPSTLIIWFEHGTAEVLWLTDTKEFKRKCNFK